MKIISGGQTGADQAGWRAAKAFGIATGGWMPAAFRTEDGFHREFAKLYGASETYEFNYHRRTELNARWADITLWYDAYGTFRSPGYKATRKACGHASKPFIKINCYHRTPESEEVARMIVLRGGTDLDNLVINVAGNRASTPWPAIGVWVEARMRDVFLALGYKPVEE